MDFNELHLHCMNNGIDYETTMSRHTVFDHTVFDPWRNMNDVKYFPAITFHNWRTNRHYEITEQNWGTLMDRIDVELTRIIGELGIDGL